MVLSGLSTIKAYNLFGLKTSPKNAIMTAVSRNALKAFRQATYQMAFAKLNYDI
jgi:hypothetical protein